MQHLLTLIKEDEIPEIFGGKATMEPILGDFVSPTQISTLTILNSSTDSESLYPSKRRYMHGL